MKTLAQLFVILLLVVGCDANLVNLTKPEPVTTSTDIQATSSASMMADISEIPWYEVKKTCSVGGQFKETDGSTIQGFPLTAPGSSASWDPRIKHEFPNGDPIQDQDLFHKGTCEMPSSCVWEPWSLLDNGPNGHFWEKYVASTNKPLNKSDHCSGGQVTQYEMNAHSEPSLWVTGSGLQIGKIYCSAQTVDCPYGTCDDGECTVPVKLRYTGPIDEDGEMTVSCGSESQTKYMGKGMSAKVNCHRGDSVTLTCDVTGSGNSVAQFEKKSGSQWYGISPDCGSNQASCTRSPGGSVGETSLEYRCEIE